MVIIFIFMAGNVHGDIAFVANINGNWDLFIAGDNGQNPIQLTDTPYDEKDPSWSYDRKQIVYSTSDGKLNIVNIETKNSRQLPSGLYKTPQITPSLSPNGQYVAFAQFLPGKRDQTDLMLFDMKFETTRTLLEQYAIQMWPAWSPDSRHLVYTNTHCSSECGRIIQELWLARLEGRWARQLLMTNAFCQQPVWSRDGRQIAFSSDKSGNYDIWVFSVDSQELKQLTFEKSLDIKPAWSEDGKQIAFISSRSGFMKIWIKDLHSGKLKDLNIFQEKSAEFKDIAW
ncbi:WD40-repeat-containing [Desulfonema limicola]|uniref:WD40-repeat-containing n=1 Tax=Desulfonema limicola TaxID=45656 RepID=A0A975B604_9BACT|nr:PD40 domain-containing protein [Desulfonema limicola]QTA79404.1 WD40-repeat-containing [Desulfonema limicola]